MASSFHRLAKGFVRQFSPAGRALRCYRASLSDAPIDESLIVLESQQGRSFNGNIFYIVKALHEDARFSNLKLLVPTRKERREEFAQLAAAYGLDRCYFIDMHSSGYIDALTRAKYLFTDTSFPTYYVKRPGQVVLNTWHGTPLKAMGRSDRTGLHALGNIQRNFAFADYLLYPNYYTAQHMFDDYMLYGICGARVLFCGYPRNEPFLKDKGSVVDKFLSAKAHKGVTSLYAYMPTWRPASPDVPVEYTSAEIISILMQMDARLRDDELMLVSLHPLQKSAVDFSLFEHIDCFPNNIETYDTLSRCDLLITDYSSVLFDFAVSGKPIILFDYDQDLYLKDRGMYIPYEALPFPHAESMEVLFQHVRSTGSYCLDTGFLDEFCSFDRPNAAIKLCESALLGSSDLYSDVMTADTRKNLLIYGGNLARNGITSALMSLIRQIDHSKYHVFVTFDSSRARYNQSVVREFPPYISFIPKMGKNNMTLWEKVVQWLYLKRVVPFSTFDSELRSAYCENRKRLYGNLQFHAVIQFCGYDWKRIYEFSLFDCRKIIYVHSDMLRESHDRNIQRLDMLKYAFNTYDKIAMVSEDVLPANQSIAPDASGYAIAHNLFDYAGVREKAKKSIQFDEDTSSNVPIDRLLELLNSSGKTIVSIGRYSKEKQHRLLIDAFSKEWEKDPSLSLIIIGGNSFGSLYRETVEYVSTLECSKAIACVLKMSNPYPILAKADGFILPSKYEGFGLVLLEADALNIPVVATNIPGPRGILEPYGGLLVENSLEGVRHGIRSLADGSAKTLHIDFEEYNRRALTEFYELLD